MGAGNQGKKLILKLKAHNIQVDHIMDNDTSKVGQKIEGVLVMDIQKFEDESIYIITPASEEIRHKLVSQLCSIGVNESYIIEFDEYEYYKAVYTLGKCQEELGELYRSEFEKEIDWENPKRYTEILNWEKTECK